MFVRRRVTEAGLAKARLETLVDGTAAIVLTLLILEVHVPRVEPADLPGALYALKTAVLTFFISVLVIGTFWLGHVQQMNFIARVDRTLVWVNVAGLGVVAFIPFTTALLGEYFGSGLATALYGANITALGLVGLAHWTWASRGRHLLRADTHEEAVGDILRRVLLGVSLGAAGVIVAFWFPPIAMALYALAFLPFALRGRFDDHLRAQA